MLFLNIEKYSFPISFIKSYSFPSDQDGTSTIHSFHIRLGLFLGTPFYFLVNLFILVFRPDIQPIHTSTVYLLFICSDLLDLCSDWSEVYSDCLVSVSHGSIHNMTSALHVSVCSSPSSSHSSIPSTIF